MLYKEDWEQAQKRFKALWKREIIDRVAVQVTAPRKDSAGSSSWDGWMLMRERDNPEIAIAEFEKYCAMTYFGGEAFPQLWINFGPGFMATYIGAEPKFAPDTVWFETPKEWQELKDVRFDAENKWWKLTKKCTELSSAAGKGKWITGTTDLGGPLDIAASLRGTQALLLDLVECPDRVKALTKNINSLWADYYNGFFEITKKNGMEGTGAWMGLWSPRKWYPFQCDFSAMISPEMFKEFVVPDLLEQCRYLDNPIYHWDGPGQIPHLDLLLDIPKLDGIQWVPGAGQPGCESRKWFPLYKRIQEKKKMLILGGIPPNNIEELLKEISPKGLLISTWAASEDEAKDLLSKAAKWSAR
ncbi:hypothetical protein COY52_02020 [Candidatus Desantisbacteria bacterium CG_4_10_14_0_8_um_filter_48_22]|uniref:Uroporphyrinogen decarboxylase (URO-D) domain-containing protein n=1 Tax=Candidatus Desantisbacteria bacterium CG_4_10_14_0_8_um_filter_48_22 TaxID=1974543 RepID=A0A2M7SF53_9BACT|nr:MAG: hypothetical protein AUJ67_04475 [Candidatus Desantisbacteria bacterium CG1_02_49_89]PIV55577.1 MAG: hypothetical protein COS16_06485 [Candidatus Desantisbacteria bacterium CG02_land_8_20_14_3_00_49_13]PIZ17933.1 MAG: hypothetical protein COY52_02020 [Candidatus Desantisbacteria bacterium CG_4_10_14_0_8_um_filter_48_22]PJB28475.1 MAG: hypothetical protein CO111_01525 [Candidatus Desantisbacteria bacterium CG_4_9_14_3_um_filter_50_7]